MLNASCGRGHARSRRGPALRRRARAGARRDRVDAAAGEPRAGALAARRRRCRHAGGAVRPADRRRPARRRSGRPSRRVRRGAARGVPASGDHRVCHRVSPHGARGRDRHRRVENRRSARRRPAVKFEPTCRARRMARPRCCRGRNWCCSDMAHPVLVDNLSHRLEALHNNGGAENGPARHGLGGGGEYQLRLPAARMPSVSHRNGPQRACLIGTAPSSARIFSSTSSASASHAARP